MIAYRNLVLAIMMFALALSPVACITTEDEEGDLPQSNGAVGGNGVHTSPDLAAPDSILDTPSPSAPTSPPTDSSLSDPAIVLSNAIADIVERIQPAVVFISAKVETRSFFFDQRTVETSSGSGVVISTDGYILTNNHVVADAFELEVSLPGVAEPRKAEIIGTDPLTDLAVIKINGKDLPTVPFGNASALRPGNLVIAMGYPLALEHGATITLGVVSNTERSFTLDESTYYDVIQTDAAINPGNSGGPLIDLNGRIVGISSVMAGMAQNIGFAVSANTAQPVYEALVGKDHRVVRPWLGVVLATVTPDIAEEADLSRNSGVVVESIEDNSPAGKAGLKVRDVITELDGKEVTEATQLIKELWRHKIGDEVTITYWRDNTRNQLTVKLLMERPE